MATHTPGSAPEQFGQSLQYGAPVISVGSGDIIVQSGTHSQEGDLREFKDENGNVCTLLRVGDFERFTFTGLLSADVTDLKKGELFTLAVGSKSYKVRVETWSVAWANEDAKRVSITARTYPSIDTASI